MVRKSLVVLTVAALLAGCGADPVQGPYSYSGSVKGSPDYSEGRSDVKGSYDYSQGKSPVKGDYEYSRPKDQAVTASSRVEKSTVTENATTIEKSTVHPGDEFKPLARVDRDSIKVTNRSDKELKDVNIQINGKYTTHLDTIPAHGSVTIDRDQFKTVTNDPMPRAAHVDRIDVSGSGKHLSEFNPPSEDK